MASESLKLYEAKSYTIQAVYEEGMNSQTGPNKSTIKYQFPARGAMPPVTVYWHDGGILPPRPEDVPEDQQLGDGNNGSLYFGTNGYLTAGEYGGKARLLPDERMADYTKPAPTIPRIPNENPYQNWLDGIRSGEPAASDFSYAGPLTEVANMGNVALHSGDKELEIDVVNLRVVNDANANTLLTKEYRAGWELPC